MICVITFTLAQKNKNKTLQNSTSGFLHYQLSQSGETDARGVYDRFNCVIFFCLLMGFLLYSLHLCLVSPPRVITG